MVASAGVVQFVDGPRAAPASSVSWFELERFEDRPEAVAPGAGSTLRVVHPTLVAQHAKASPPLAIAVKLRRPGFLFVANVIAKRWSAGPP
jgi:hypothetical protein